ncbi:MAG TPA: adenylate/guanylate cyclase domain-containing protein [Ilumatobacteraceae bacterium]|nr:adenylate/guanylate cyclase domain-containing protein [Ilumatobacteraceae bacterium]
METPKTLYADTGDVSIAYQVLGEGPIDIVYMPGWVSNLEVTWEDPSFARMLRHIASFSRLILFDKRGTGLSDQVSLHDLPTIETRMDDVRAVMDAAGSESATLLGHSEGGSMSMVFAATHPDRTDGLVLVGSYASRIPSSDYPWAPDPADREAEVALVEQTWGDPDHIPPWVAPSRMSDPAFVEWMGRYMRLSASPRAAAALLRMNTQVDTRHVLPTISVPTLCLYRTGDQDVKVEEGRWIAERIEGAKFVEIDGSDHFFSGDGSDAILAELEEFVTGSRGARSPERVLATVLFTDIVGSTERAAQLGDRAWTELLERHNDAVRSQVARFRGREVDTQGDGFLATFDGPGRAIAAAQAIGQALSPIGVEVRAGLHTGEIELLGDDVAGLAVHIGARVASLAGPGEVLVSRTVKDLVTGSGTEFESRGLHVLKGVPDEWQIYAVI